MKEKTIGLFLLARKNEYQRLQETSANAMAFHLKTPLEIQFADGDEHNQKSQIETFIRTHASGSVLVVESVVDRALEPVARDAARAGMGWFLLHRVLAYMDDLRREYPGLPIGIVTSDQKEIGRIQGRQFQALLPGGGTVLYVQGPEGSTIVADRLAGMKEIIDSTPIKYESIGGDWSEESGERAVMKWLTANRTPGQVQLVGCQNDAMAVGALRALAYAAASAGRADLSKVRVTGVDGTPDCGISMVDQKRLAATVIMPAAAGEAVQLIHQAWTTPDFVSPAIVRLPVRSYPDLALVGQRAGS
jgi:ribose transport system substrate-binding protein